MKRIWIKGFRTFKREQEFEIRPLTIVTGANNTGKSSFIKALRLFSTKQQAYKNNLDFVKRNADGKSVIFSYDCGGYYENGLVSPEPDTSQVAMRRLESLYGYKDSWKYASHLNRGGKFVRTSAIQRVGYSTIHSDSPFLNTCSETASESLVYIIRHDNGMSDLYLNIGAIIDSDISYEGVLPSHLYNSQKDDPQRYRPLIPDRWKGLVELTNYKKPSRKGVLQHDEKQNFVVLGKECWTFKELFSQLITSFLLDKALVINDKPALHVVLKAALKSMHNFVEARAHWIEYNSGVQAAINDGETSFSYGAHVYLSPNSIYFEKGITPFAEEPTSGYKIKLKGKDVPLTKYFSAEIESRLKIDFNFSDIDVRQLGQILEPFFLASSRYAYDSYLNEEKKIGLFEESVVVNNMFPRYERIHTKSSPQYGLLREILNKKAKFFDRLASNEEVIEEFGENNDNLNDEKQKDVEVTNINQGVSFGGLRDFGISECQIIDINGDLEAIKVMVKKLGDNRLFNLSDMGLGISSLIFSYLQIISFYTLTIETGNTLVLVEEPEINLHPNFQSKFAKILTQEVTRINDSLKPHLRDNILHAVIETHSEYMIRMFQYMVAKGELSKEDIVIYNFGSDPDSDEYVRRIEIREDGSLTKSFLPGFLDEAAELALKLLHHNSSN